MKGDSPDELYDAIRQSITDSDEIARQTGLKPANLRTIKHHLFFALHWLDLYEEFGVPASRGRFDSSGEIANAWQRLQQGMHFDNDLRLLKHEMAEIWYMRKHGPSYRDAHRAAYRRFSWDPDQ